MYKSTTIRHALEKKIKIKSVECHSDKTYVSGFLLKQIRHGTPNGIDLIGDDKQIIGHYQGVA